ncbi:MAG: head decoration protein [Methylomicrobium sp.]|nr:head decoration protein [Methylomicrobium sp.]
MQTLIETVRPGEFLLTEVHNFFRQTGDIAETQKLQPGTVLAKNSNGEYVQLDDTAVDGTQVAAGILYSAVDATDEAKPGIIVSRLAVVNDSLLTWPAEISDQDKAAAIAKLAESHLIVK